MRKFKSGATRSDASARPLYLGFFSPLVVQRFGAYMARHREQKDGTMRDPDNWQKGMPRASYLDGLFRHFTHAWLRHKGFEVLDPKAEPTIEDDLCAIIFNAQGYLHELMLGRDLE